MDGLTNAITSAFIAVACIAFVVGGLLVGFLVWVWPHLPTLVWK